MPQATALKKAVTGRRKTGYSISGNTLASEDPLVLFLHIYNIGLKRKLHMNFAIVLHNAAYVSSDAALQ